MKISSVVFHLLSEVDIKSPLLLPHTCTHRCSALTTTSCSSNLLYFAQRTLFNFSFFSCFSRKLIHIHYSVCKAAPNLYSSNILVRVCSFCNSANATRTASDTELCFVDNLSLRLKIIKNVTSISDVVIILTY